MIELEEVKKLIADQEERKEAILSGEMAPYEERQLRAEYEGVWIALGVIAPKLVEEIERLRKQLA